MNTSEYVFADRMLEQRRLASQAELFDPLTERLFRAAGLGTGMRVLDLGSGAGDVAILAARLVGRDGEVVGVDRDPEAVASATARVAQGGMSNIRFVQSDLQTLDGVAGSFDAAVGRLILMYLPEPAVALRRAAGLVRPGGLVCVHEGDMAYDWAAPMTPLWAQTLRLVPGRPGTGKRNHSDGAVVVPDLHCRGLARSGVAPGMRGGWWRSSFCLGVGQRDARTSAADGAVRHHDRR
jgi:SAM-dependent methyltransferase